MKKIGSLVSALLLALLLAACAPTAGPGPQIPAVPAPQVPAASAPQVPAPAKPAWQVDWEKTLMAAKEEGKLLVYTGAGPMTREALYTGFLQGYGIKMESIAGRVGEMMEKILTERRVGLYFGDVVMTSAASTTLPILKPKGALERLDPVIVLPEVLDPKVWRTGGLLWLDSDHMVVAAMPYVSAPIFINTTQVRAEEVQSYRDLLNPKWRGKITTDDPTASGQGSTLWSVVGGKIMGWDFVQEMVTKQQLTLFRDKRQGVEWVARGKYPIGMALSPEIIVEFLEIGAPIKLIIPREGAHAGTGNAVVSVLTQAPHPNAAKVFVNWFLSKEGQTVAVKGYGLPSARLDVSNEGIDPARALQPGMKYIQVTSEEFVIEAEAYKKKAKQIFEAAMR